MREYRASDLNEYLEIVAEIRETEDFLFRGQREDKPLLPKLARLQLEGTVLDAEESMLREFRRQCQPFLEFPPESDWDWMSLAQHHGLPTRLLDWSKNPLAALWFAVANPPGRGNGVVWILSIDALVHVDPWAVQNPLTLDELAVIRPRHISRRIGAQMGWFTCHPYTQEGASFLVLERAPQYQSRLHKVLIERSAFSDIRWDLDGCGVNAASIFPDLDGLCRHLEWAYSLAADECDVGTQS